MKNLTQIEINSVSGGFEINDFKFGKFIGAIASIALQLGIFVGKIIKAIIYDAPRGIIDGAAWGLTGCK